MTFSGIGTTSVTEGGQSELEFEADDSLKGVSEKEHMVWIGNC